MLAHHAIDPSPYQGFTFPRMLVFCASGKIFGTVRVPLFMNTPSGFLAELKYLLTYLTGAAKRAIEAIRLSYSNYEIAINTFRWRFGRRELR
ncbi:hypothetical protein HPB50_014583 [Hyalomma asiaticum]|uniref:Uncharacterized protein n=1 Tax=Hyalomma asiaticum TaxID=266040 RepID=A0ACB7RXI9_HYAAI|nr:hypothetical protein HPB50_014583 [Hyalomma asiaticum]